mgnify:CR=1 FL=1
MPPLTDEASRILALTLPRTRLAYVHLRNLLTDAKRDRAARVSGYVAIWLPEEFLLLFLREGEVVNAVRITARGAEAASIAKSTPGRAYVRLGQNTLIPFQAARADVFNRVDGLGLREESSGSS